MSNDGVFDVTSEKDAPRKPAKSLEHFMKIRERLARISNAAIQPRSSRTLQMV